MAYNSTAGMSTSQTSLYSTAYAPRVELQGSGISGAREWRYTSTHSHTDIEATGFFADGKRHGLKVGDSLLNINLSTAGSSAATWHVVSASTGAVAASDTAGSSAWGQAYNVSVSLATT